MVSKNIKTGEIYVVSTFNAINATNSQDGERVVIYSRAGAVYVREVKEFLEKFHVYQGHPDESEPCNDSLRTLLKSNKQLDGTKGGRRG